MWGTKMKSQSRKKAENKVYHSDLKGFYCNKHARPFFERHGWSWSDFIKNGIDIDIARATNDQMVLRLLERIEKKDGRK